jgi:hypothetical protein
LKKHIKAQKKLHRIAFKIYRDLVNQLNPIPKSYMEEFDVLYRVLTQRREDKNKVYSIHEPEVLCISKGKEHKQYEFGNKGFTWQHHTSDDGINWQLSDPFFFKHPRSGARDIMMIYGMNGKLLNHPKMLVAGDENNTSKLWVYHLRDKTQ